MEIDLFMIGTGIMPILFDIILLEVIVMFGKTLYDDFREVKYE